MRDASYSLEPHPHDEIAYGVFLAMKANVLGKCHQNLLPSQCIIIPFCSQSSQVLLHKGAKSK